MVILTPKNKKVYFAKSCIAGLLRGGTEFKILLVTRSGTVNQTANRDSIGIIWSNVSM